MGALRVRIGSDAKLMAGWEGVKVGRRWDFAERAEKCTRLRFRRMCLQGFGAEVQSFRGDITEICSVREFSWSRLNVFLDGGLLEFSLFVSFRDGPIMKLQKFFSDELPFQEQNCVSFNTSQ